jgi:hypothetical protein
VRSKGGWPRPAAHPPPDRTPPAAIPRSSAHPGRGGRAPQWANADDARVGRTAGGLAGPNCAIQGGMVPLPVRSKGGWPRPAAHPPPDRTPPAAIPRSSAPWGRPACIQRPLRGPWELQRLGRCGELEPHPGGRVLRRDPQHERCGARPDVATAASLLGHSAQTAIRTYRQVTADERTRWWRSELPRSGGRVGRIRDAGDPPASRMLGYAERCLPRAARLRRRGPRRRAPRARRVRGSRARAVRAHRPGRGARPDPGGGGWVARLVLESEP